MRTFVCISTFDSNETGLRIAAAVKAVQPNLERRMRFVDHWSHPFMHFVREEAGVSLVEFVLIGTLALVVCLLILLAVDKFTY